MIIKKVILNKHTQQKLICVPKNCEINAGDYVIIRKLQTAPDKAKDNETVLEEHDD